jgi:alpha-glucosidase
MPLSRTLAINYTQDENVYDVKYHNQFLFGDNILVAPVESTQLIADVYLPAGEWYRLSSGEKYTGGQVYNVDAPLTDLPVFIKAGAIIPMQNIVQSTNEKGDGILELNIWYGNDVSSFTYYEDDGTSYDYENGDYFKREIIFDPWKRTIIFSEVEGSFKSRFSNIQLVLHGFENLTGTKKKAEKRYQHKNVNRLFKIDF